MKYLPITIAVVSALIAALCLLLKPVEIPVMVFEIGTSLCKENKGLERVWTDGREWQWFCKNGMRSSKDTINNYKPEERKETKGESDGTS